MDEELQHDFDDEDAEQNNKVISLDLFRKK
jgi:hypothetical protein